MMADDCFHSGTVASCDGEGWEICERCSETLVCEGCTACQGDCFDPVEAAVGPEPEEYE